MKEKIIIVSNNKQKELLEQAFVAGLNGNNISIIVVEEMPKLSGADFNFISTDDLPTIQKQKKRDIKKPYYRKFEKKRFTK